MILMMTMKTPWSINIQNSFSRELSRMDFLAWQLPGLKIDLTLPGSEFPCKCAEREDLL
jgi:hypothetical protein